MQQVARHEDDYSLTHRGLFEVPTTGSNSVSIEGTKPRRDTTPATLVSSYSGNSSMQLL